MKNTLSLKQQLLTKQGPAQPQRRQVSFMPFWRSGFVLLSITETLWSASYLADGIDRRAFIRKEVAAIGSLVTPSILRASLDGMCRRWGVTFRNPSSWCAFETRIDQSVHQYPFVALVTGGDVFLRKSTLACAGESAYVKISGAKPGSSDGYPLSALRAMLQHEACHVYEHHLVEDVMTKKWTGNMQAMTAVATGVVGMFVARRPVSSLMVRLSYVKALPMSAMRGLHLGTLCTAGGLGFNGGSYLGNKLGNFVLNYHRQTHEIRADCAIQTDPETAKSAVTAFVHIACHNLLSLQAAQHAGWFSYRKKCFTQRCTDEHLSGEKRLEAFLQRIPRDRYEGVTQTVDSAIEKYLMPYVSDLSQVYGLSQEEVAKTLEQAKLRCRSIVIR